MSEPPNLPNDGLPEDGLPEDELLAAEYALRLLDGGALAGARAREAAEPAFAAVVAEWNARLAALLDDTPAHEPDAAMWGRISAALALRNPQNNVVALKRKIRFWRASARVTTALAASLVLAVGLNQRQVVQAPPAVPAAPAEPREMLVATITPKGAATMVVVSVDRVGRSLIVTPATLKAVAGHSHELWVVPETGKPRSLGVLARGPARRVIVAADVADLLASGSTLAVSAEDKGGSDTGQPQGPIVATGKLTIV